LKYFVEIKELIDNSHNDEVVEFLLPFIAFKAHSASGTCWDLAGLPAIRLKMGLPSVFLVPQKTGLFYGLSV
jgi:hypothetical protein